MDSLIFFGFWRVLEWIVSKITGQQARNDDYKWTGIIDEQPESVKKWLLEKQTEKMKNN